MTSSDQLIIPDQSPSCPVTGLPITARPEWTEIRLDSDFYVTFSMIGKAILLAILDGKSSDEGTKALLKKRDDIINEAGLTDKNYVELRDYSGLIGAPSKAARIAVLNYFRQEGLKGHLLGAWAYGAPFAVRLMVQIGLSLYKLPIPVGVAKDYEEAIQNALKVLRQNDVDVGSKLYPRIKKEGWALEIEEYWISFELIGDDILYTIARGKLKESSIEQFIGLHKRVFDEARLTQKGYFYRIINWERFDSSTWKARRIYMEWLNELNKKTPCRLTVIFGPNKFMKALVAINRPFVSIPVIVAHDLPDALEIIERQREQETGSGPVRKTQKLEVETYTEEQLKGFANEMLQVVGGINWDQAGVSLDGISEEHPFKPVMDALAIIKLDLDSLLQEKEKSQQSLQESEERYRTILESTEEAYFEVDLRGNFTFFNNSLSEILGYSPDELMGMNNRDYMPPGSSREIFDLFSQVYKTGKPVRKFDYEVIRKDGTHGFHGLVASLRRDQNGRPIGFRGIAHDITIRKQAEEALRKSEERFRSLVETTSDWIWETDAEGQYTYASPRIHDLLGYETEEVIGRTPFHLMAPCEREHLVAAFGRISEERRPFFNFENVNLHKDGRLVVLETSGVPRLDPEGNFLGFRGIDRDITGRKQAEDMLRKSEKYFKEITDNSSDVIIITDKNGDIKYCSRSIARFTGYKPEELIGRSGFTFIHQDDAERAADEFGKIILSINSTIPNAFRIVHKDGSERYFEGLGKNLLDNPDVAGIIMNIHDVTDSKRAEADLQRSEHRYRLLVENANEGILVIQEGNVKFVNSRAVASFGYSEQEFLSVSVFSLIHPEDLGLVIERYAKKISGDTTPTRHTYRMLHKSGQTQWIEISSVLIEWEGAPATLNLVTNITDRKQAEQEIALLADIGRLVGSTLNIDEVYERFAAEARKLILFDRIAVNLHDLQQGIVTVTYAAGEDIPGRKPGDSFPLKGSVSEILMKTRAGILSHPASVEEMDKRFPGHVASVQAGMRSLMAVPLISRNEVIASLHFRSIKPNAYTEQDLRLAEKIGMQIAGAIANAQLYSDLRKTEKSLRESEEKYRWVMDNMADIISVLDMNLRFTYISPSVMRVRGYTAEEAMAQTLEQTLTPESLQISAKIFEEEMVLEAGGTADPDRSRILEVAQYHKDGSIIWLENSLSFMRDKAQKPVGIISVSRNITDRKQVEEALRDSETQYRLLADNMRDQVWLMDLNLKPTYISPSVAKSRGYTFAEIEQLPLDKHLTATSLQAATEFFAIEMPKALANPSYFLKRSLELEFCRKDGSTYCVETAFSLIRDENGKPFSLLGVGRDITDRKLAEEKLRDSEEKYRNILESIEDGYFEVDLVGNLTFFNPAICRILGYPREEIMDMNNRAYMDPENAKKVFQAFNEIYVTGIPSKGFEWEILQKDGARRHLEVSASLVVSPEGKPTGYRGVARDVSERKKIEIELQKHREHLEEMITARTNELAEAMRKAEYASIAKSEFLANMSHEIRTPMNGVIGMIGLLLDTDLDEDQQRYAETVRNSGESLLTILNDILDFSKIEAHKLDLEMLDFDLRSLLDDFAAMLAQRAHEKGLEFTCAAAPDVPSYLRGDPGRLRQVLNNLTGNAVKFTHKGEIAVRASLISETDNETLIRFSIKDTGIGIPAEKQEFLFQKFTQADASTTRKYGGTGLGLAISKQLVEMMGGEIGIVSAEGQGAEFWFTARFARQAEREHPFASPAKLRGVHVLVVDDNATNREVLMAQFLAWGVRSEETTNGFLALQALYLARDAGDPFSVAILDMQMPGMDGAALARAIKTDEKLKDTRLVLCCSLGQRGDAKRMQEIGFDAYLVKPVRHGEIIACLSAVMAGTVAAQQEQPIVTRHTIREIRRGVVRILLAEDNITNQQVALGILKKLGLRADAVANGAEAVKALETLPYDLVLMDVQMPEMNGIEATRQIRNPKSAVRNHQIPIIAMTAGAMQGDREECLEAGMNDYVSKPVSPHALAEALDKWLPREAAAAPVQAAGKRGEAAAPSGE